MIRRPVRAAGVRRRDGGPVRPAPARSGPRPRPQPDVHEPPAAGRVRGRRRGRPSRCRSSSSSSATSARIARTCPRPGHLPPAAIRYRAAALGLVGWAWIIAQGIVGGESAGDVATLFLWVYGWVVLAMLSASSGRSGTSSTRSRPSTTLWPGSSPGVGHPPLGPGRVPGRARALAGRRRLRRRGLARARPRCRAEHAVHRPRRLHRPEPGDDGPVRARRMALAGRRVQRLVPAARQARRRIALVDEDGRVARRPFGQRPAGARLRPRRRRDRRPRRRLDPVRRAVADADLVRPVRRCPGCSRRPA